MFLFFYPDSGFSAITVQPGTLQSQSRALKTQITV